MAEPLTRMPAKPKDPDSNFQVPRRPQAHGGSSLWSSFAGGPGFSLTLGQLFFRKNVSSQTSSKEGAMKSDQQNNGDMKPIQNFTTIPITQVPNYNLSTERWNAFSHHNPVKFSRDGVPCILFWTKRITIKFKNQTWLDLTDEAFGEKATVDVGGSNCSEESAMLSVKFGDAKSTKDLAIRFLLTNHNKLPSQSWFSLQQVEVILNNSVRATFHATGVGAPSSYSYRCRRVSSLRRSARPLLAGAEGAPRAWELSFTDFQETDAREAEQRHTQKTSVLSRVFLKMRGECKSIFVFFLDDPPTVVEPWLQ